VCGFGKLFESFCEICSHTERIEGGSGGDKGGWIKGRGEAERKKGKDKRRGEKSKEM
jgi:hypothetical protein